MSSSDYADKIYRLTTRLESLSKGVGAELNKILVARFKLLAAEVATGSTATKRDVAAINRLFDEIIQNTSAEQTVLINSSMTGAAAAGYGAEMAGLSMIDVAADYKKFEAKRITNKAWSFILQEHTISVEAAWDKYLKTSSARLKTIPKIAYQNGWSISTTVGRLRQATQIDKRSATTMARTILLSSSNVARDDVISQTSVKREIYKATLDSRTTQICQYNDGKVFDIGHGPHPPLHFNCRSVRLAIPSDMTAAEFKKGLQSSSRGPDGKTNIIDYKTYGEWLGTQKLSFQEEILGKRRAKLFNDGKVSYSKMFTRNGSYVTVADLEKRYT